MGLYTKIDAYVLKKAELKDEFDLNKKAELEAELVELKYELKTEIFNQLDDQVKHAEEYYLYDHDCPQADFCQWGFSEGVGLYYGELDYKCSELIEKIKDEFDLNKKDLEQLIADCSEIEANHGMHRVSNEVFSVLLGELELEILNNTSEAIAVLDLDDDEINNQIDAYYKNGYLYINLDYNRWSLVLDYDQLKEKYTELKNNK